MLKPALIASLLAATSPALAAVDLNVGINLSGDVQIQTVVYGCGDAMPSLTVKYINAAPNFFAIVPVEGKDLVFVNVLSGSGAKYEAGKYVWWNKGAEASLQDLTEGLDAAPVWMCSENIETP